MTEMLGAERRLARRNQQAGGLTPSQLRALFAFDDDEVLTAGQLAKIADLNPGSITGMLDALVKKGIVERRINATDHRAWMVSLTEHGHTVWTEERTKFYSAWDAYLGELSQDEVDIVVHAFQLITKAFDSL